MRKVLIVFALLLIPSGLWAQGILRVSSVLGHAEWRSAFSKTFVPLSAATQQLIQVGDELRTGPNGATVVLEIPDGSYMVISENSKLVIEDFWSPNLRSLMNLTVGKVRFYIQRFGGRPGDCPVTEDVSDRLLRLPFHNTLSEADQDLVVSTITAFPIAPR